MKNEVEKERLEFNQLLLKNPNYFGTYPNLDYEQEMQMQGNTKYEELECLGFYPEEDLLEAVLDVKLSCGYSGDLCSDGSFEFVRFYVDWDGDGNFDDADEDVGIVSLVVHDIPNADGPCRENAKPLSYAVKLKLSPKKRVCTKPYLVRVRAILEWNRQPPPASPNHAPVWGNVLESWIQIEPRPHFLPDFIDTGALEKFKLQPSMIDELVPVSKRAALPVEELRRRYRSTDVPEHRLNAKKFAPIVAQIKKQPSLLLEYQKDPSFAAIEEAIKPMLYGTPEVKYEELTCVGLDYDQDILEATIHVKRRSGYLGDKCSDGSHEYVAFWIHVYDMIEQQCVWRYLGVSSVNVHDIEENPNEGLHYAVYLQTDLSDWKEVCSNAVVLQVRGILSWNEPPPDWNPWWEPTWGNVKDVLIQLKPDDPGLLGDHKPYIWSVGNMKVENISGNFYTLIDSVLGFGYANDISNGHGFTAVDSPFGGTAKISGTITNAPDNPAEADKLRYKVQYQKAFGGTGWHDIANSFDIGLRIDGEPSGPDTQHSDGGYFKYQVDLHIPRIVQVQDNVIAIWNTRNAEGDGLYFLRMLVEDAMAPLIFGVPAGHLTSRIICIVVDNTPPFAEIDLDDGGCTRFEVGDDFNGTFTATDAHILRYSIAIEPATDDMPSVSPTGSSYPVLAAPGVVDGVFTVTTTASTTPCGYVVRLGVRDRTIVNNQFPGHYVSDSVGLCLLEETEG